MHRKVFRFLYKKILRPILFKFDPELVHDHMTCVGEFLGTQAFLTHIVEKLFSYKNQKLERNVFGINFPNPIGLSAGFDYDGKMVKIMKSVGFGFNTIGTITNIPYDGNPKPRLVRLIKSKSILVNKGFKSEGVDAVLKRINDSALKDIIFGVSVGSSNIPEINNINVAIADYVECFKKLESNRYIKYYELNISCPNTCMTENFLDVENFKALLNAIKSLNLTRPVFIKMPNEGDLLLMDALVETAVKNGFNGFIFSNLAKDRNNKYLHKDDAYRIKDLKGNMSGLPTEENANKLLKRYREKYSNEIVLIGVGGVFDLQDANAKISAGADLIQMITGVIFEGPEIVGLINEGLA